MIWMTSTQPRNHDPIAESREIPLAPANFHNWASSITRIKAVTKQGAIPLNTQSFRCLQIVQAPRMMREFIPLRTSPLRDPSTLAHQPSNEASAGCGARDESHTPCRRENQNCLANTHPIRRCSIVSASWSHNGHLSGLGRPRLGSLSAVQQRLWATSQKKRHLGEPMTAKFTASSLPGTYLLLT